MSEGHASHSHDAQQGHHGPHITSLPVLFGVFGTLIVLSIVTVLAASVDFGEMNLFVAMGIASVKALLVSLFFMHLLYDSGFNRIAFFGSFLFIAIFVGFTLMDSGSYQNHVDWEETVDSASSDSATTK